MSNKIDPIDLNMSSAMEKYLADYEKYKNDMQYLFNNFCMMSDKGITHKNKMELPPFRLLDPIDYSKLLPLP